MQRQPIGLNVQSGKFLGFFVLVVEIYWQLLISQVMNGRNVVNKPEYDRRLDPLYVYAELEVHKRNSLSRNYVLRNEMLGVLLYLFEALIVRVQEGTDGRSVGADETRLVEG